MPKDNFLINRLKGIGYAFRGAFLLVKTESSIQIQVVIALLVTAAGFYFDISNTEWILQILAISLVLGIEGLNTAIEKMSDYTQPEFDDKIGFIKDVSAGAVMWVSIGAVIVGLIIYVPKTI
ncbi:MAG: diacylglycerol kinase family protein [Flavobacteriaceae bacterium]